VTRSFDLWSKGWQNVASELFNNGKHICVKFSDLSDTDSSDEAVQSNQF